MATSQNNMILSRRATLASLAAAAATTTLAAMAAPEVQANDHVLTARELAAFNFEPWQHGPDDRPPPSHEEWMKMAKTHLFVLHMAWGAMFKTKAELMTHLERLDNDTGLALMQGFTTATAFFECMLALLNGAETRILVAGSALELQDGEV